jgi:hypothetical protein
MPNEGQRRPARHAGRVDRFSNGRLRVSWRAGCTTAGSAASLVRGRSTPGHERVEAWAPERAASQVAQNHARSEADLRISIDRPDDPLDIRWLDGRYVAQCPAPAGSSADRPRAWARGVGASARWASKLGAVRALRRNAAAAATRGVDCDPAAATSSCVASATRSCLCGRSPAGQNVTTCSGRNCRARCPVSDRRPCPRRHRLSCRLPRRLPRRHRRLWQPAPPPPDEPASGPGHAIPGKRR